MAEPTNPMDESSPPPPSKQASPPPAPHSVVSLGGRGQGYAVLGHDGQVESLFDTKKEAEAFAKVRRKFFEGLAQAAEQALQAAIPKFPPTMFAAATSSPSTYTGQWPIGLQPPRSVTPAGGWPGSMFGIMPRPVTPVGPGGFPAGMYPAPPPPGPVYGPHPRPPLPGEAGFIGPMPGPVPWIPSPGKKGFIGPMPAPPTPRGPVPWIPAPGEKGFIGPMPAPPPMPVGPTPLPPQPGQKGFIGPMPAPPPPPVPWIPAPGEKGFIGPLPAPPTPPPGPAYGPAAPTYRTVIDALAPAVARAFGSMPHANGGQFNWGGFASAAKIASQIAPAATGPAVVASANAAGWATVGKEIARSFGSQLTANGGLLAIESGMGRFAELTNDRNRRLAPYNGQIATAFAQLDYGDTRRDFRMGYETSGTAANLAKSIDRMRDAWMPSEILQANLSNRLGIFGAQISRINGNVIGMPATALSGAMDYIDPDGDKTAMAGRAAGITQWGLWGAGIGARFGGPWGAAIGGGLGLGLGFVADRMEAPEGKEDPWGDFLIESRNLPVLRPQRMVALPRGAGVPARARP